MKKKIFGGLFVLAIAAVAAFNVNVNFSSKNLNLASLNLGNVEAMAYDLPEVGIECDGGSSGTCFGVEVEEGLMGTCQWDCIFTGEPDDYCNRLFVEICNFAACWAMSCGG